MKHAVAAQAEAQARLEWDQDSHGEEEMTEELFYDAMFELVDIWTTSTDAAEYVEFLQVCTP